MVHLIPGLKRGLGGQHFATEEDQSFAKPDAEWYDPGIYKLTSRYNNCLNEQDDCVEK